MKCEEMKSGFNMNRKVKVSDVNVVSEMRIYEWKMNYRGCKC